MGDAKRRKAEIDALKASGQPKNVYNETGWTESQLNHEAKMFMSEPKDKRDRIITATLKLSKFLHGRPQDFEYSKLFGTRSDNEIGLLFEEENLVYNVRGGETLGNILGGSFVGYDDNEYMYCPGIVLGMIVKKFNITDPKSFEQLYMNVDITELQVLLPNY